MKYAMVLGVIVYLIPAIAQASLENAMRTAASGMKAQSSRLEVIAQNIANSETTGLTPGSEPYRRKTIVFENVTDPKTGAIEVKVKKIDTDPSQFKMEYKPHHPAANKQGYVLMPNVSTTIESADAREAKRAYEANITTVDVTKSMLRTTVDLLR